MSVQKVEMFTVICDNCQESADEGSDYSCWNDENGAKDVAMEAGFVNEYGNDYCPKCYSYNDEDELIINNERTKTADYPGKRYQPLFDHLSQEHGLILHESEMDEIIRIVNALNSNQ